MSAFVTTILWLVMYTLYKHIHIYSFLYVNIYIHIHLHVHCMCIYTPIYMFGANTVNFCFHLFIIVYICLEFLLLQIFCLAILLRFYYFWHICFELMVATLFSLSFFYFCVYMYIYMFCVYVYLMSFVEFNSNECIILYCLGNEMLYIWFCWMWLRKMLLHKLGRSYLQKLYSTNGIRGAPCLPLRNLPWE